MMDHRLSFATSRDIWTQHSIGGQRDSAPRPTRLNPPPSFSGSGAMHGRPGGGIETGISLSASPHVRALGQSGWVIFAHAWRLCVVRLERWERQARKRTVGMCLGQRLPQPFDISAASSTMVVCGESDAVLLLPLTPRSSSI